jgi:multidrug efflux system membrane fusion protein
LIKRESAAPRHYAGRLADGLRIVQQGLNPGDKVIVEGLQKVFMPGMPVNAKTVAMTASAALN